MDPHETPQTAATNHTEFNETGETSQSQSSGASDSKSKTYDNNGLKILREIRRSSSIRMITRDRKNNSLEIFNHTMRGTQTPLTLIGVSKPKRNDEEQKSDDINPENTGDIAAVGRTEISVALNSQSVDLDQQKSGSSGIRESLGPSTSVKPTFSQFRVEAVTVKFSHEAATQATPPHPSLTSTKDGTATSVPMDVLQIATSVSSNRSGPKSEVLTVTTDYSTRSPDARSLMLDVIEQDHPRRYISVEPSTPVLAVTNSSNSRIIRPPGLPGELRMAPPSISSHRSFLNLRRGRRGYRWNWINCLRRNVQPGEESDLQPYTLGPPPTYSGIFGEHRSIYTESRIPLPPRLSTDTSAASFVAPIPPPSYAQAQGLCGVSPYSMEQMISVPPSRGIWSARPTATICPRCTAVVVSAIEVRRSALTHVSALALFFCGCWPCCLIPYCIDSCKSTHHYCPVCRTYLGTYTPW